MQKSLLPSLLLAMIVLPILSYSQTKSREDSLDLILKTLSQPPSDTTQLTSSSSLFQAALPTQTQVEQSTRPAEETKPVDAPKPPEPEIKSDYQLSYYLKCKINIVQNLTNEQKKIDDNENETIILAQDKTKRASFGSFVTAMKVKSKVLSGAIAAALIDKDNDADNLMALDEAYMVYSPTAEFSLKTGFFYMPFYGAKSIMPLGTKLGSGVSVTDTILKDSSTTPVKTTKVSRVIGSYTVRSKGIQAGYATNGLSLNVVLYNQMIKSITASQAPNPYHLDAFIGQLAYSYKTFGTIGFAMRSELFNYKDVDFFLYAKPVKYFSLYYEAIIGLSCETGKKQNCSVFEVAAYPISPLGIIVQYQKFADGAQKSNGMWDYSVGSIYKFSKYYQFGIQYQNRTNILSGEQSGTTNKLVLQTQVIF